MMRQTALYLLKQALDLETPQQPAAQGPGVTFHPPVNGTTQGAIGEAFTSGMVQPGFLEKNMPYLQAGSQIANMIGQHSPQAQQAQTPGTTPHPATPAPVKPPMPAVKPPAMPRRR